MSFSPEEIANRVFTPSVEGYHQGEVRDFLQRVAREVRNLHAAYSAQSAGTGPLVPLPGADDGETSSLSAGGDEAARLAAVSDRLEALVAQLEGSLGTRPAPPAPPAAPPVLDNPVATQAVAAATSTPATQPAPAAASDALPAAAVETPEPQPPASKWTPADGPTYIERVPIVVEDAPQRAAATAETSPLPRVPADKLSPSVGAISPTDPMFSDSANDLLDGVLDDVMGKLSDPT